MKIPTPIVQACEAFSRRYEDLEFNIDEYVMDYDANSELVVSFVEFLHTVIPDAGEYVDALAIQYTDALFLTDPKAIRRMRALFADTLSDDAQDALIEWEQRPAFFSFFTIQERICKDFFVIEDRLTGDTYRLYSPGLQTMQEERESRNLQYFSLMMDNGQCLQTSGMIHYTIYTSSDVIFLCNTLDKATFSTSGFTSLLIKHPMAMFFLDFQASFDALSHKGQAFEVYCTTVDTLRYTFYPEYWKVDNRGKVASYVLEHPSDAMRSAFPDEEFWSDIAFTGMRVFKLEKQWMVMAMNRYAFEALMAVLDLPLPEGLQPVALSLVLRMEKHQLRMPWAPFSLINNDMQAQKEEPSIDMSGFNVFFEKYSNAYNNGTPFDSALEAKKLGIDEDVAKDIIEQLQKKHANREFQVSEADAQYRIDGWPVPSPAKRSKFGNGILSSNLFLCLDTDETDSAFNALSGNQWRDAIEELGFFVFLQESFGDVFYDDNDGFFVLNSFLWIILHLREQKVLVRSIALEIFCLFPYLNEFYELDSFVEIFSEKVYSLFCRTSLCSIASRVKREERKRGMYTVQASSFLQSIIRPIP